MHNSKEHRQPLYLGALGIVCPLGANKRDVLSNLIAGYQGGMRKRDDLLVDGSVYAGCVDVELPLIPERYAEYASRNNRMLLAAYLQIQQEVEQLIDLYGKERVAVVLGSSTSGILEGEQAVAYQIKHGDYPDEYHYKQQEVSSASEFMANYLDLQAPAYTISTACSSGAKVFGSAASLIRAGIVDAVIVGGVDSLCRLTINGFAALESLSEGICNPCSKNRDGINIGEAAALFTLSKQESPIELLGVGESSDAFHMSAPCPQGSGAKVAIKRAMSEAGVSSEDVDYVNLHGTATEKNDIAECNSVSELFGDHTPCSSTKPMTGHTLGAAGAMETGFCWLLLSGLNINNALPANIWDQEADEAIPRLDLLAPGRYYSRAKSRNIFVSNSFAFGGSNVCVVIGTQNK